MAPDESREPTPAEAHGQLDAIAFENDVAAIAWTVILRDGRSCAGHGVVLPHLLPRLAVVAKLAQEHIALACPAQGRA